MLSYATRNSNSLSSSSSTFKWHKRPVNLHPPFLKIGHPAFWKMGHPAFWKKQSAKNQGHCNSKREEAAWSLLFLNKEWPCFFQPVFLQKPGCPIFKNSGCRLTGRGPGYGNLGYAARHIKKQKLQKEFSGMTKLVIVSSNVDVTTKYCRKKDSQHCVTAPFFCYNLSWQPQPSRLL